MDHQPREVVALPVQARVCAWCGDVASMEFIGLIGRACRPVMACERHQAFVVSTLARSRKYTGDDGAGIDAVYGDMTQADWYCRAVSEESATQAVVRSIRRDAGLAARD